MTDLLVNPHVQNVLIIGGEPSLTMTDNFFEKLRDRGINPKWQWDWDQAVCKEIPAKCDGVLILENKTNHKLADGAVLRAKESGVRWARIQSKFSHALPILRFCGFLNTPDNGDVVQPVDGQMYQAILGLVVQKRSAENRVVSFEEAQDMIQVAFGKGVELPKPLYQRASNEAAGLVPTMTDMEAEKEKISTAIAEWTRLVVEETPALILDPDRLSKAVLNHLDIQDEGKSELQVHIARTLVNSVKITASQIRSEWDCWRSGTPQERSELAALKVKWAHKYVDDYYLKHEETPTSTVLTKRSARIFGSMVNWKKVKPYIDEVNGMGVDPEPDPAPTPPPEKADMPNKKKFWAIKKAVEYFNAECVRTYRGYHHQEVVSLGRFERTYDWIRKRIKNNDRKEVKSRQVGLLNRWEVEVESFKLFTQNWIDEVIDESTLDPMDFIEPEEVDEPEPEPGDEAPLSVDDEQVDKLTVAVGDLHEQVLLLNRNTDTLRGEIAEVRENAGNSDEVGTLLDERLAEYKDVPEHLEALKRRMTDVEKKPTTGLADNQVQYLDTLTDRVAGLEERILELERENLTGRLADLEEITSGLSTQMERLESNIKTEADNRVNLTKYLNKEIAALNTQSAQSQRTPSDVPTLQSLALQGFRIILEPITE